MSLQSVSYIHRKHNRSRATGQVLTAGTVDATHIVLEFNKDIQSSDFETGMAFSIDKKEVIPVNGVFLGNGQVQYTLPNPITRGQTIMYSYDPSVGDYTDERNMDVQAISGAVLNYV